MSTPTDLFSLAGKICVITGGHRGLGRAMAEAFLKAGAASVIINGRSVEDCFVSAKTLSEFGECQAIPGDLSTTDGVKRFVEELSAETDHVDILVNNAGTAWGGSLGEFPEKGWDRVMDLNVKSPFFLVQDMLPLLKKERSTDNMGSIINIGSIAGIRADAANAYSYSVSKAAINHLTRNLAHVLAGEHIRVNGIAPGRFHSKMTEFIPEKAYEAEIRHIPLHRWGKDKDIMGLALLLASDAGAYMTGQIINVDGGTTLL